MTEVKTCKCCKNHPEEAEEPNVHICPECEEECQCTGCSFDADIAGEDG